ncbi:histone H1-like [Glossina fuscipes fuscipes]
MSDAGAVETSASPVVAAAASTITSPSEKKIKKSSGVAVKKAKKSSTAPSHPPTQQMVDAAIKNLKERGGSSLLAIKKYINGTYKCDSQKLAPFIKKYLKSSVASGKLIQTKGKGASGSFKLSAAATKDPKGKANASGSEKKAKEKTVSARKMAQFY